jgi:beta-glucosidase
MALKKLVGFQRVSLGPGQIRKVTIHVDSVGLSYWSTATHKWMVAPGRRTFVVGASSRAIKLQAEAGVRARR